MSNDNTLGAPTEGLGQTVTFAVNGSGGVPQTQAAQRGTVHNNSTGGGAVRTAQALQVQAARQDPTFEVLAKLGGAMLQPYIEQERTAKYMEGMQKASQGQAITEIVDEQPWYSKLFGSTSLVDGARAWTASTKAIGIAVDMETNMAELRKLPAADFAKHATDAMMNARTGDSATDMMLTQQVSATLPSVMKSQAKAFIEYKTEVAGEALASNFDASFSWLGVNDAQVRTGNGTKEEDDLLGAGIEVIKALTPPATMPLATFNKILTKSAVKAVLNGNYAVMSLLENSKRMAALSADEQIAIRTAYRQASQQSRLDIPDSLLTKLDDFRAISSHTEASKEDIYAARDAINKEYTRLKGDPGQLISNATTLVELEQLRNHQNAEQARLDHARATAVTKDDKQKNELAAISNLTRRVVGGDGTQPYLLLAETKAEKQEVFDHLRAKASPAVRYKVLVQQAMVAIDEKEKNMLETVILQAKLSKEPAMLYNVYQQQYLPLVKAAGGDEYVAQLYAGKFADDMAVYHKLAGGGALDASNQGAAYNEVVLPRAKELPSNVRNKEIIAELTTWKPVQYLPFTGYALRDPAGYAAELGPYLKSGLPVDGAIKYAVAQSKDLNRMAGYHWRTQSGNTSLSNWLAKKRTVGTDNMEEALDITVKLLSEKGGLVGNVSIAQTTDTATGEPQLYLRGLDDKDNVRLINFTGSDVEASWLSGKGRMSADDFRAGGGLAVRAPDGLPSGSDSPEVWAAYRKKQALDKATKQNKVRKQ